MRMPLGLVAILLLALLPGQVNATVYGWKGAGGVLHLSNDPEEVPDPATETVTEYTSKLAQKAAKKAEAASPPANVSSDTDERERLSAYERGLERGLASAEKQVRMAADLARSVLTAAPQPLPQQPVQIVIQQAAPVVRHVSPAYNTPFYGFIGPYTPHSYFGHYSGHFGGYSYGFRQGRFPRHSHFSPGRRRGRPGIYFPRGHFSRDGFLFGHGIVLR